MHGKRKVRFVQCTEKVLGQIKCVESGLLSFLVLLTFWPNGSLLWAVLCIERCLAAPLASTCWKPIVGDSRHTQNIQINDVIGENEKCLLFYRKNPTDFLANSVFIVIYISFLIYQFLVSFHCFCGSTVPFSIIFLFQQIFTPSQLLRAVANYIGLPYGIGPTVQLYIHCSHNRRKGENRRLHCPL